jgi:hypothetical protein
MRPNVKPILIRNYQVSAGTTRRLDDFPAPCLVTASFVPLSTNVGAGTGQKLTPCELVLCNSQQEATALVLRTIPGIAFPLRLRRLVGVWVGAIGAPNAYIALISVIGDGEEAL